MIYCDSIFDCHIFQFLTEFLSITIIIIQYDNDTVRITLEALINLKVV